MKAGQKAKERVMGMHPLTRMAFDNINRQYTIQMGFLANMQEYLDGAPVLSTMELPEEK